MYKIFLLLIFVLSINLFAFDESLLKEEKQDILQQKEAEIRASSKQLKYNWISPLNLSASTSKSNTQDDFGYDTSIQLNQDIFRSGGIGEALEYGDLKLAYDLIGLDKERTILYQELFVSLLKLEKLKFSLEQTEYKLKNGDIEVFLKKEQYKIGTVDITELNRALMDKNSILKTLLTTKTTLLNQKIRLTKLTDITLEKIKIPHFKLLSKEHYLKNNINILKVKLQNKLAKSAYNITKSDYLPKLSVNAQYGYQDTKVSSLQNSKTNHDYHSLGLNLSMPLDYNTKAALQEKKAISIRTKLEITDLEADEIALYNEALHQIENYQDHSKVIEKNILLYDELIDIGEKGFKSGYKSGYDVETLKNTKIIDLVEIKINDIDIQIEQVKLHFATNLNEVTYEK